MFRVLPILAALIATHLALVPYAEDDAYIHLRVAKNLVHSGGPFFNSNDHVQASTSLVWLGILAIFEWIGILGPRAVALINALLTSAAVCVWGAIIKKTDTTCRSPWLLLFVDIALIGSLLPASTSLMETPLALLLFGLGVIAFRTRSPFSFALFAIAAWTRPEILLLAVPFVLTTYHWPRQDLSRSLAVGGVAASAGLIAQLYFFASIFPHTMHVKRLVYDVSISEFLKIFSMASVGENLARLFLPAYVLALLVLMIRGIQNSTALPRWGTSIQHLAFSGALLLFFGYAFSGVPVFQWYTPLVLTPVVAAISMSGLKGGIGTMASIVLLSPSIVVALCVITSPIIDIRLYPWIVSGARVNRYIEIGKAFDRECPESVLAAPEIGGLGWGFPGQIIDGVGLATQVSQEFHPMQIPSQRSAGYLGALPVKLVDRFNPDAIIGPPVLLEEVLRSPDVAERYETLHCPPFVMDDARILGDSLWGRNYQAILVSKGSPCLSAGTKLCGN